MPRLSIALSLRMTTSAVDLIELSRLQHRADEAASLLRVLANPDRLLLLCQLVGGECCVGDLEERTGIHQPTLSQQLGVLRNEGLVQTRRDGKRIYYTLARPEALAVLTTLYTSIANRR